MVSDEERDNLLFIDQNYESQERVLKLAKKMKREW
jgi:preprotein translocase subunit Sss1